MARITLHIEAESMTDLADTISALRYPSAFTTDISSDRPGRPGANIHGIGPDEPNGLNPDYEPEAGATQDAEPGERQRRTRRTKAQIEADAAAALAAADPRLASGASGSQPSPSKDTGATSEADPFVQVDRQPTSSALQASPGSPTLQDLRKALADHMGAEGKDGSTARNALKSFKSNDPATVGQPCVRVSELHPADYAAAIEALSA